jgi:drug/metabolite transporter (DMT)-like permease
MMTATEMIGGSITLAGMGLLLGQGSRFRLEQVSPLSWVSLAYLTVFGSLIAFSAYVYLLQVSTPARVATYAFVNPVVAVFLGWLLNEEQLTPVTILASLVIVAAVAIITYFQTRPTPRQIPAK